MQILRGGITSVPGFVASGVHGGIKKKGLLDLALFVTESEATVAGCFTKNRFKAAPLLVTQAHLKKGRGWAIIVNSGNANAGTGKEGLRHAKQMVQWTAQALKLPLDGIFVASTGVISDPLPMTKIESAIQKLAAGLSKKGGHQAALAIMTTDTVPKEYALKIKVGKKLLTFGGVAKGAGMIHPNMATMLAFIGTDARISRPVLQSALRLALDDSFHTISIDGETSTNDTVLCLANGLAAQPSIRQGSAEFRAFTKGLTLLCQELAKKIVRDGEGATKFLTLNITGAKSKAQAKVVAESIVRSVLVKTALYGEDPNWGRIIAAIGASSAIVYEEKISLSFGGIQVSSKGLGLGKQAETKAKRHLRGREIELTVHLGLGRHGLTYYTTDLSEDFVKINAAYRT